MNHFDPQSVQSKGKTFYTPANLLLVFGLLFGIAFCIFIPYGAGFDEEQHLVRIFDIADFHFLPNRSAANGTASYSDFYSLSYQRR